LTKFNIQKTCDINIQKIFQTFTNFKTIQEKLPQYFPHVLIKSSRDNVFVIEEHVKLTGLELVVMTKHIINSPTTHEIFFIGGNAKGSHILEQFEELPNGTKISLEVDLKLKGMKRITQFFNKDTIQNDFENILDELIKVA